MGYNTEFKWKYYTLDDGCIDLCNHDKPENFNFCPECGKPNKKEHIGQFIDNYIDEQRDNDKFYGIAGGFDYIGKCKWYAYNDDMVELSKEFPTVLFELTGYGEVKDDIWQTFYFDGRMYETETEIIFKKPIKIQELLNKIQQ